MNKCNRDCFHCPFEDCVVDDVTKDEDFMQKYRDASATVTGFVHKGHGGRSGKKIAKRRYDSSVLYGIGNRR